MPFINGIGAPELIIILVIALIVVGPGRLPDVGSALGKSIREFRRAATDVKDATSLDPKTETASPATSSAPVVSSGALPATSTVVPAGTTVVAPATDVPDVSERPDREAVTDEQPTRTA